MRKGTVSCTVEVRFPLSRKCLLTEEERKEGLRKQHPHLPSSASIAWGSEIQDMRNNELIIKATLSYEA